MNNQAVDKLHARQANKSIVVLPLTGVPWLQTISDHYKRNPGCNFPGFVFLTRELSSDNIFRSEHLQQRQNSWPYRGNIYLWKLELIHRIICELDHCFLCRALVLQHRDKASGVLKICEAILRGFRTQCRALQGICSCKSKFIHLLFNKGLLNTFYSPGRKSIIIDISELSSNPASTTYWLCDFGQIACLSSPRLNFHICKTG